MNLLEERFNKAEEIILKRSFRQNSGFEESYYIFDYDPASELYIRERIEFLKTGSAFTCSSRRDQHQRFTHQSR